MQTKRPKGGWLRSALIILAVLIVVAIGGVWVLSRTGRSRLQHRLNDLKAAGEVLTFAELEARRPRISDNENSALVLLEVLPELEALGQSELLKTEPVPYLSDTHLPVWDEPWSEDMLAAASTFLGEDQQLLAALDRLYDLPRGRFPNKAPSLQPPQLDISHFRAVRGACKHKALQAMYEAHAARLDDAAEHLITALNINATVSTEPQIISMLVYAATDSLVCETIERLLAIGTCSNASLTELVAALTKHEQSDALVWALRGDLAWTLANYDSSRSAPLGALGRALWFARDTAKTLELLTRLVRVAKSRTGLLQEADAVQKEADSLSGLYVTTKMRVPSLHRAVELWERRTAMLRCTIAALAAERFRGKSGRWPSSLQELVPDYLDRVPVDPFSGQPLNYVLTDELLTIYSVGENAQDDGGRVEWTGRQLPDIGFRLLPPEKRISRRKGVSE